MKKTISVLFAVCLLFSFTTVAQAKDAVTVNVCVYEFVNNKYIAEPTTITDDRIDNAFDALQMLEGLSLSTDGNGNINTLNEFRQDTNGGERCWIYRVNGKKLEVSPASYLVQDGDKIEVIYITKLSDTKKTLPQPVPTTIPTTPAPTTAPTTVAITTTQVQTTVATTEISTTLQTTTEATQSVAITTVAETTKPQNNEPNSGADYIIFVIIGVVIAVVIAAAVIIFKKRKK